MQFPAKQIAPPKEWGTFEDLCHALFKRVFSTLASAGGNKSEAARRLGIRRKTLLKKLKQYGAAE